MKAYDIVDVFLEVMTEYSKTDIRVVIKDSVNGIMNLGSIELVEMPETKEKVIVLNIKED